MLNNKQLQFAIDSLEIKLREKKINNFTNITNKYTYSIQEDTNSLINEIIPVNKQQQYNYTIRKLKTLKSITKSKISSLIKHKVRSYFSK